MPGGYASDLCQRLRRPTTAGLHRMGTRHLRLDGLHRACRAAAHNNNFPPGLPGRFLDRMVTRMRGASVLKMRDVLSHKSMDVLQAYVRDTGLFRDHAGAGLL
jgi:hypothetical protein